MKAEEIRAILQKKIPWTFGVAFDNAAAAIAEAWEADKNDALEAQDACWHDIVDEHLANIANLQAQVAELCETIELCDRFVRSLEEARSDLVEDWPIREVLDKALAAAPKAKRLLWRKEAVILDGHIWLDDEPYQEVVRIVEGEIEGQEVIVTVETKQEEG